jgi:glucan phosphoethanolaminetransferase (alkaline phosphatase superfamily)
MQTNNSQSQTKKLNLPAIFFLLVASISAIITAYATFYGRQISLYNNPAVEATISDSATKIWGLHMLFALVTLCLFVCAIICLVWQRQFGRAIAWWQAIMMFVLMIAMLVTFFPKPFEFKMRYYYDPEHETYIFIAKDLGDLKGAQFTGSAQKIKAIDYIPSDSLEHQYFACETESAWWWGNLTVQHRVFPNNNLDFLQKNCQAISKTEAEKLGLGI